MCKVKPNSLLALSMKKLLLVLVVLLLSPMAKANFAYYGFQPDIVTNYVSNKKKMGFVRVTVELMVAEGGDLEMVEHHAPLLRDAIINLIGQQSEDKVRSITGRQEIQKLCEEKVKELMNKETGRPVVKKLLFTQWLAS